MWRSGPGVSIKTASNVVNGYPHVRDGTRERVAEAIAALGYRPHLTARSLRGGRTGVVALAVPDLTSPYFAELAAGSSSPPSSAAGPCSSTRPTACASASSTSPVASATTSSTG